MKVGDDNQKEVTILNNYLYLKAREILEDDENMGMNHIGWQGVSAFIDWIETNYILIRKEETNV